MILYYGDPYCTKFTTGPKKSFSDFLYLYEILVLTFSTGTSLKGYYWRIAQFYFARPPKSNE